MIYNTYKIYMHERGTNRKYTKVISAESVEDARHKYRRRRPNMVVDKVVRQR